MKQIIFQLNHPGAGIGCLEISVPETVEGDTAIVKISLDIPVSLIYDDKRSSEVEQHRPLNCFYCLSAYLVACMPTYTAT